MDGRAEGESRESFSDVRSLAGARAGVSHHDHLRETLQDLSMHDRGIVFNQSHALDQAVCNNIGPGAHLMAFVPWGVRLHTSVDGFGLPIYLISSALRCYSR